MNVEYSRHALTDLHHIAEYYATTAGPARADAVVVAIRQAVARVTQHPESGRPILQRPGVRVALLPRYRYKIFISCVGTRSASSIFGIPRDARGPD
jgi:plasmid stabilization system protein ParE